MTDVIVPPGLILIIAGLLLPFLRGGLRSIVLLIAPLITLYVIWQIPYGQHLQVPFMGFNVNLVSVDALSRLFAIVFALATFTGALFALYQEKTSELAAAFVYAGSAIAVTYCGDLISLFIFWEIMAVASTLVVLSGGKEAHAAGLRYAVIHFMGGVVLMAGIAGEIATNGGSIEFTSMSSDLTIPRYLILLGFLINAGAVPFSAWLPDAYPKASWSGAVFLSAFTTKTAVYVIMRGFPGTELLIYVGLCMIFYGVIYAILENDIRRILVYSIVNQVGFMLTAIGVATEGSEWAKYALNGAAAHAFAHIVYKALLLMAAGAVIYQTGKSKCTELGGLFRTMPITMICGIIGALSISAFPFTSGFVSKSLITKGVAGADLFYPWALLTTASACAFLYVGLKFPWFVFFNKDSGLRPPEVPTNMLASMGILSAICLAVGMFPSLLYGLLPYKVNYDVYSAGKVISQLQLLLFAGLAFFLLLGWLKQTMTITLDFDWFYRRFGVLLGKEFNFISAAAWNKLTNNIETVVKEFIGKLYKSHGPRGIFARSWPTGGMAFWTTLLLGAYLLLYYI